MATVIDLIDKLATFPIAYGYQPVRGWPIKHYDITVANSFQRVLHNALAEGQWDALEKLWVDAFEIAPENYTFHNGGATDTPDAFFPNEPLHPWTAHISAKAQSGLSEDQLTKLFGIYRTLRTGNYNGAGQQLNSVGTIVSPSDPRTEYFFKPNPANVAIDQLIRWGKKLPDIVNFPAWVNWRDFNDEEIPWDDAAYTPRGLSLTPTGSGSLTPGNTYYTRVATLKGADVSSASQQTIETLEHSITLQAGQTAFQVAWLIKGDEEVPPAPQSGITGYRIYLGTTLGIWLGYFEIATPASRTYLVTTTAGITVGNPLDTATAGLLRDIKRFECGPFFVPPYDLAGALDKICQISCADWQWSGLGTNTYRNDKVRFLSPASRNPVFTLNLAETGMGSFRTFPVDRRTRPNQIVVNFRDRNDPYLAEAQPVILNREAIQEAEFGQIKSHPINAGTMYRSQAQRVASFYARVLCDLDQMAAMIGSPKTYHILPADVVNVTNDTPDWTDVEFIVRKKEENVETNLGDPFTLQLYSGAAYSDTDHTPLPRPLPTPALDPFAIAPLVTSVILAQKTVEGADDVSYLIIEGQVTFTPFHLSQIGRVWWKRPSDELSFTADPGTDVITTEEPHNHSNGTPVIFRADSDLSGNLDSAETYFVRDVTSTTFKVALTVGGPVVDITSTGSGGLWVAPFKLTHLFLTPTLPDLTATFSLGPVEEGFHNIKVVSESVLQQKLSFEQHTIYPITISAAGGAGVLLPPEDFILSFDEASGDGLFEWLGVSNLKFPHLESYDLEIRNSSDTATIGAVIVTPSVKDTSITPPLEIHPDALLPGPYLDQSNYGFINPGGVLLTFPGSGGTSIIAWVRTKVGGTIIGGLLFEVELPWASFPVHAPNSITLEPDNAILGDNCFGWVRVLENPLTYSPTSILTLVPEDEEVTVGYGDRLSILMRDDGVVEFYINYLGESSQPVAVSGVRASRIELFKAHVRHEIVGPQKVTVRGMRMLRSGPEWPYNAKNQILDYGSLPGTIKARVRQRAFFEGGPASTWTNGVFIR